MTSTAHAIQGGLRLTGLALVVAFCGVTDDLRAQFANAEIERICAGERIEFELPSFAYFDADGNGTIEAGEAARCRTLRELFTRLDLDSDSGLSREEYAAYPDLWERHARSLGASDQ